MKKIAITGGIGSGKSAVTEYVRSLGFTVVDADEISRDFTSKNGKSIPLIRECFGDRFFLQDGSLDRARIRKEIFSDETAKKKYEWCTTRLVISEIDDIIENAEIAGLDVLFFDIPLLFESGLEDDYDLIWLVTADTSLRVKRVSERDSVSEEQVLRVIDSQLSDDIKRLKAHAVIDNSGSLKDLYQNVDSLVKRYCK